MTADIELLPLPDDASKWLRQYGVANTAFQMEVIEGWFQAHARAVAEHNVAARDAEIEALRAEVKSLQTLRDVVIENHGYWKDRAELMEEALRDARVMVEDWAGYASEYLRNKHDLAKADSARAALRDHDQEVSND